jgi:predicted glycogen debranching enzyme
VIRFGPQTCGSLDAAAAREWLVADGLGGYAMGTVAGLRTRRYHGLLVVAAGSPANRMLGLAALDPVLVSGDARYRLATDEWAGGVDPRGHELLASFDLTDGVPRWRWQIGGVLLERELAMQHGSAVVGVVHRLLAADRDVTLELTPLCTWRSVHGERFGNGAPSIEHDSGGFVFEGAYRVAGDGWRPGGEWFRGVRAREEAARGLNDLEDLWAAGSFTVELEPGQAHEVVAGAATFEPETRGAAAIVADARFRAVRLVRSAGTIDDVDARLVLAADQFTVTSAGRPTAVAGYPRCCGARRRRSRRACSRTRPTPARSSTTPPTARSGSSTRSAATST